MIVSRKIGKISAEIICKTLDFRGILGSLVITFAKISITVIFFFNLHNSHVLHTHQVVKNHSVINWDTAAYDQ